AALDGEGWVELPALSTVLPAPEGRDKAQIEVQLQACMTEVGTLEVRCVAAHDAQRQWLLPFSVRGALAADAQDTGDRSARQGRLADAVALIE
ncbi:hypothetical protein, partial [Glaesserella parasuis]